MEGRDESFDGLGLSPGEDPVIEDCTFLRKFILLHKKFNRVYCFFIHK